MSLQATILASMSIAEDYVLLPPPPPLHRYVLQLPVAGAFVSAWQLQIWHAQVAKPLLRGYQMLQPAISILRATLLCVATVHPHCMPRLCE